LYPTSVKLDYFIHALKDPLCKGYAYGGSVHGYCSTTPPLVDALIQAGLAGEAKEPFERHLEYKYVIYNDGNTVSDRMRLLLCTDSIILRKQSPYEEFYTGILEPNIHYVPYNAAAELPEIHARLEADPGWCDRIRQANRKFVDTYLRYDAVLDYTASLLQALFCRISYSRFLLLAFAVLLAFAFTVLLAFAFRWQSLKAKEPEG
jgi:hypothetical protein